MNYATSGCLRELLLGDEVRVPMSIAQCNVDSNKTEFCFIMPYHISENVGGGAEVQAWLLAKELARRGYRVAYIARSVRGKAGETTFMEGVTLHWVRNTRRFPWLAAPEYYRLLKELSPSTVVQRMTSFETGVAAHYCRRRNVPFVWICTGDAIPFPWHFIRKQWILSKKVQQNWFKRAALLSNALFLDLSRHYGMAHTTLGFTQNEFQRDALFRSFGFDSLRMISGHELPQKCSTSEERLSNNIVLWVANLGTNKRPQLFIELAKRNQGNDWRFVMIGGKDDEAYVRELFHDKPNNLEWLGRLSFDEALSWFDNATWFVNTSEVEGFPNTFIQAWLRGVPVLSLGCDPDSVISCNKLGYVCGSLVEMTTIFTQLVLGVDYQMLSTTVKKYALYNHSVSVVTDHFLDALCSHGLSIDKRQECELC